VLAGFACKVCGEISLELYMFASRFLYDQKANKVPVGLAKKAAIRA